MIVHCRHCTKPFSKIPAEIKRSPKHFCSKRCVGLHKISENNKRLFEKARKVKSGCWEWVGGKNRDGYGKTRYAGRIMLAHRAAYLYEIGRIPQGMCVLHKCDNPCCVNPEHLFLGTHQDNMDDMARKGRRYRKQPNPPKE